MEEIDLGHPQERKMPKVPSSWNKSVVWEAGDREIEFKLKQTVPTSKRYKVMLNVTVQDITR